MMDATPKLVNYLLIIIAALAVLFFLFKGTAYAKPFEKYNPLASDDARDCRNQGEDYFLCEKGVLKNGEYKPDCLKAAKPGTKGGYCNPKSYQNANYGPNDYDVCRENCVIDYCATGLGRKGNECVATCKDITEECGGNLLYNKGECCAPDKLICKDEAFLGFGSGTCQKLR